jgi:N-acetylated-alpha-linked acidic dipeptidase
VCSSDLETIHHYVDELKRLLKSMQDQTTERNLEIAEGVFSATDDPKHPLIAPPTEGVPPYLNFAPLDNAIDALSRSAEHYDRAAQRISHAFIPPSAEAIKAINGNLMLTERALTHTDGLPGRTWFKHLIYAPGAYTGYGVKTIPGVREAIELKRWKEAETEIVRVAAALLNDANIIEATARNLDAQPTK